MNPQDSLVMLVEKVAISGDRNLYLYTFPSPEEVETQKGPPEAESDGQVLG